MAYPYYPNFYQPVQQMQTPVPQVPQVPQLPQRNSDIVVVKSEDEILNFPVAFGTSVTFKIESQPYLYTKTMGFSQLDKPKIEKYKLIKEDMGEIQAQEPVPAVPQSKYNDDDIDALKAEIEAIKADVEEMFKDISVMKKKTATVKKVNE